MAVLDRPPAGWQRPEIPKSVKQAVLKRQKLRCKDTGEGLDEGMEFDHRPALWERKFDTEARDGRGDTIPPANDPEFIDALTPAAHDKRTHGRGGEKRITTKDSDSGRRKQARNIRAREAEHRDRMANKTVGEKKPKRKWRWASRPLRSRNTFQQRRT